MKRIHTVSNAVLMLLAALPVGQAMAQSGTPAASTARIVPGTVTTPPDAAAGAISSESAEAMQPGGHGGASAMARQPKAGTKPRADAFPASEPNPKPVTGMQPQ